jgi:hypothetical protein
MGGAACRKVRSKGIVGNIVGMVRSYVTEVRAGAQIRAESTYIIHFQRGPMNSIHTVLTRHGHADTVTNQMVLQMNTVHA